MKKALLGAAVVFRSFPGHCPFSSYCTSRGSRRLLSSPSIPTNAAPEAVTGFRRLSLLPSSRWSSKASPSLIRLPTEGTIGCSSGRLLSSTSKSLSASTMPPISGLPLIEQINQLIAANDVMLFSKSTCPFCQKVKELFEILNVPVKAIELDQEDNGPQLQETLMTKTGKKTVPQVFVKGTFVGGCDDTFEANENGTLRNLLSSHGFDYDLIVIGGGSGGLAASKEATKWGKKVAVFDFVKPTPSGTTWGLGGTCVNVGCIPKKLMHQAGLVGQTLKDAHSYGWETKEGEPFEHNQSIKHNWERMKDEIQGHIKSLNFGYRVQLREKKVDYINAFAEFQDEHVVKGTDKKGKETRYSAKDFIISTGERPKYPDDCPGAAEFGISSDDIFSLPHSPGKTLVIGASYVALECAGFLRGIGLDVTVMVRSILLRGFDQEMAEKIGDYMKEEGTKFVRSCIPTKVEQIEAGSPGKLRVTAKIVDSGEVVVEEYNTVLFAMGRVACTKTIGLDVVGVKMSKNGKLPVNNEQTNVPHIYGVGDVLEGKPELTPVAIEAGVLLAKRLYGKKDIQCDYLNIPTTVFTPLEYGSVGYSEEMATEVFGADNLEVYIQNFIPLEWTVAHRSVDACYAKLICVLNDNERVVGFHYLGPNAGEVTQFAGLALKMKATKADLDALIGIHPTCAEVFTTMTVTKRSGQSANATGC